MTQDIIYDIETYPNVFTYCAMDSNGENTVVYEISDRKDESGLLLEHLRNLIRNKQRMVGFNNKGFDYPVLHHIIEKARDYKLMGVIPSYTAKEIYDVAMKLIGSQRDDKFGNSVRDSDVVIEQVDLYLIHHFDNKARSTSLKILEFNMRSGEIEDLPFPVGKALTDKEKDVLIEYNKKDVSETLKFYNYSLEAIELRKELTQLFGFDCTNFNDTKIGKQLFINRLEKENPGCCYTKKGKFGRSINQTKRDKIVIKDCLFNYIDFSKNRPEFLAVHDWFKQQVITETKGVFSDLLEHQIGDVAKCAEMKVKRKKLSDPIDKKNKRYVPTDEVINEWKKEYPLGWVEEKELKSPKGAKSYYFCYNVVETMNVVIDGFRFDFGVGGIHGAKQGTLRSTETRKLRTLDVASYYPNMAISNNVYPEHLGMTFCKVYSDLYKERKRHPKGSAANAALKLALNGTYGDSNNEYSPLYDPAYTMSITIGGQLSLCMLMGALIDHCSAEIVMCNTDGFEYFVDVDQMKKADNIVKRWEEVTGLEMEGDEYSVMFIRDVNNYISITEAGYVKTKGAYEVLPYDKLGWNKNHSAMVVAKAVYNELVEGGCAETFIRSHEDPYDFMLRTKVPRSSRLVIVNEDETEEQLQNICRYYPSSEGGKLVKIMPPLVEGGDERRLGIDTAWNVTPCNNMVDFKWGINYDYYIQEANKLIEGVS